jgi:hypothetical protein
VCYKRPHFQLGGLFQSLPKIELNPVQVWNIATRMNLSNLP